MSAVWSLHRTGGIYNEKWLSRALPMCYTVFREEITKSEFSEVTGEQEKTKNGNQDKTISYPDGY